MREKLIELIFGTPCTIHEKIRLPAMFVELAVQRIADHLIANGVTIPVRCKDCRFWHKDTVSCEFVSADTNWYEEDFCSYGERRTDD